MRTAIFKEELGEYRRTWVLAVPLLTFAFFIVGQIGTLIPLKLFDSINIDNIATYPIIIYMLVVTFGAAFGLNALWVKYFEKRKFAGIGLTLNSSTKPNYGYGFLWGLLMAIGVVMFVRVLGGYSVEEDLSLSFSQYIPIFVLMACFMVQSGVEEIVFRGWMLGRLAERYGIWVGIIANSVLFSLMHIDGMVMEMPALNAGIFITTTTLFSVFLSLMVVHQKSVWGACAWHASWNWCFITWFGLPTTGIDLGLAPLWVDLMPTDGAATWLTGGDMGPEDSIFTVIVLALGCLYYLRKIYKK